jgi:hypothetical protein
MFFPAARDRARIGVIGRRRNDAARMFTQAGALETGELDDLLENCGFVTPSEVCQLKAGSSESQFPAIDLPDAGV